MRISPGWRSSVSPVRIRFVNVAGANRASTGFDRTKIEAAASTSFVIPLPVLCAPQSRGGTPRSAAGQSGTLVLASSEPGFALPAALGLCHKSVIFEHHSRRFQELHAAFWRPPPGSRDMEMHVEEASGGVAFVILRGRLDTVGANDIDLKFNAIAGARRAVVVDPSQVDFLASLGIRVLVLGARAAKNKGGKLVILSP